MNPGGRFAHTRPYLRREVWNVAECGPQVLARRTCWRDPSLLVCSLEFQDVFACSKFNIGNFTTLEHEIDTGDVAPVKERIQAMKRPTLRRC